MSKYMYEELNTIRREKGQHISIRNQIFWIVV